MKDDPRLVSGWGGWTSLWLWQVNHNFPANQPQVAAESACRYTRAIIHYFTCAALVTLWHSRRYGWWWRERREQLSSAEETDFLLTAMTQIDAPKAGKCQTKNLQPTCELGDYNQEGITTGFRSISSIVRFQNKKGRTFCGRQVQICILWRA